jgi:hypothetical protein
MRNHPESTYRTAMALNNMGVLFKDSFFVMSSEHFIPSGGEFGDVFLQEAQCQHPQLQQQQQHQADMMPLHPLEIFSCDDDDMFVMTKTLPNVSMFVPISLRSRDFYDPQGSHKNANLSLAIMMYNLGLANLLAHVQDKRWWHSINSSSSTTTSASGWAALPATPHGINLLRGAVVALNCAQVMIDRHLDVIGHESFDTKLETLFVSAMTLKTMMWMSRFDSKAREAEQAQALLTHVLGDIDSCNKRLRELNVNTCDPTTSSAA